MHTRRLAALLSAPLVTAALLATALGDGREPSPGPGLTDAERALAEHLVPSGGELAAYLEGLGTIHRGGDRDLGFGGRRIDATFDEGRIAASITVVAFEGRLEAVELSVGVHDEDREDLTRALLEVTGETLRSNDVGAAGSWSFEKPLAEHRAAVAKALGEPPAIELGKLTDELRDAYLTLVSPTASYPVGTSFGYAGVEPDGLVAANRIDRAGRPELLSAALRGLNPEGRVVAALKLLERAAADHEVSAADLRAIDLIRRSKVPIEHCSGCVVHMAPAAEAFGDER